MSFKILVAEDELRLRKLIGDYLRSDNYKVIEAENGREALRQFYLNSDIDLIILDIMMPYKDGWEVCNKIRKESDVPVIFLTALGESHDEIKGLNIGADDYITKPFGYDVFMARVKSVLRRADKSINDIYIVNDLEINTKSRTVTKNNKLLNLSPKEYDLLTYLINNKNIALSRDNILDNVWGYDYYGDRRTVDTHIKNLRSKIGKAGQQIKTIRSYGYKLEVNT